MRDKLSEEVDKFGMPLVENHDIDYENSDFLMAVKKIALPFKDPEKAYFECSNFSYAVQSVAKEFGFDVETWSAKVVVKKDIGELLSGDKIGHSFFKFGYMFYDFTYSQFDPSAPFPMIFKKIPSYYEFPERKKISGLDPQGYNYWIDKIKKELPSSIEEGSGGDESLYDIYLTPEEKSYIFAVAHNDVDYLVDARQVKISKILYRKTENIDLEKDSPNDISFWSSDESVAGKFVGNVYKISYDGIAWPISEYLNVNHKKLAKIKEDLIDVEGFEAEELMRDISMALAYNVSEPGTFAIQNKNINYDFVEIIEEGAAGDWEKDGYEIKYVGNHKDAGNFVDSTPHDFTQLFSSNLSNQSVYALFDGEIVGYAQLSKVGDKLVPIDLKVKTEHQRKGLASAMYAQAEKESGLKIKKSDNQTDDAKALWSKSNRPFGEDEDDDVQNGFIEDIRLPEFFFGREGINDFQHSYKGSDKGIFDIGQHRSGHPYTFLPHRIKFYVEKNGLPDFLHVISNRKSNALKAVYAEKGKDMIQLWSFVNIRQEPGWKAFEKAAHDAGYKIKDFSKGEIEDSHGYWLDEKVTTKSFPKKLNARQLAKYWYETAYSDFGQKATEDDIEEYLRMIPDDVDHWELKILNTADIEGHHTGHNDSDDYIQDYKKWKEEGNDFPPIIVAHKEGNKGKYLTADGQHRLFAAKELGDKFIRAYVPVLGMDESGDDLYLAWLKERDKIEAAVDAAEIELKKITGDNKGSLTPDSIKSTELYKKAKGNFDIAFKLLRDFNGKSPKEFMRRASRLRESMNNLHAGLKKESKHDKGRVWKNTEKYTNLSNRQRSLKSTLGLWESIEPGVLLSALNQFSVLNLKIALSEIHHYFQKNNLTDTEKQSLIQILKSGETKYLKIVSNIVCDKDGKCSFRMSFKSTKGFVDDPSNFRCEFDAYCYHNISDFIYLTFLRIGPRKEFYHQNESIKAKKIGYRGGDFGSSKWVPLEYIKNSEVHERGNEWFDDSKYINHGYEAIWVTHNKEDAEMYGDVRPVDLSGAIPVHEDPDGGFLYVRKSKKSQSDYPADVSKKFNPLYKKKESFESINNVDEYGIPSFLGEDDIVTLNLTKSNISKIIKWTTSKYNEYKKDEVVKLAYHILYSGKGSRVFKSGAYTPSSVHMSAIYPDYLVDGKSMTIKEGYHDGSSFKEEKTYFFKKEESVKPVNVKWKEVRLRSGFTRYDYDYNQYSLSVGGKKSDGKYFWSLSEPGNIIARGDVDSLEMAKKEAEKALLNQIK